MPKPREGETRDDFLDRCMGDAEANRDYPDRDQRYAVCTSLWDRRNRKQAVGGHYHIVGDDKTGPAIIDPDNVRLHFHYLDGDKTSTDGMGPEHTHTINGQLTTRPIHDDEGKNVTTERESKQFGGYLTEVKEQSIDGVNVGIVKGYISTWDVDRGNGLYRDQFVKGCFQESIADYLARKRDIRFKDHHGRTIGKWLIDTVREDNKGLYGEAQINLDVQQGREAMSLIRQRVLTDFSIGFSVQPDGATIQDGIRTITKAYIWEGSIVDEPMNPHANVVDFKSVVPYQDLPLADRAREWDSTAAVQRVKEFTDSEDEPSQAYRRAFLWYDGEDADLFASYKLPIADVVDGRLVAVPRAIFAAAAAMQGARGGVNIPEGDRAGVIRHIERYYAKMDMESPFKEGDKQLFVIDDVKNMSKADLEKALRRGAAFTKSAAKYLAGHLPAEVDNEPKEVDNTGNDELKKLLDELRDIKSSFKR